MNLLQFLQIIIGIIVSGSVIGCGAFYFIGSIRKQDLAGLRSDNKDLRDRLNDKDKILADLQVQVNEMKQQISKMTGIMEEKDRRIDALSHVEVKFPVEFTNYMADMRNFTTQVHQYMIDSSKTLAEIHSSSK